MNRYQTIIGLEIHVQLKTRSKMFCACSNDIKGKMVNQNICPVCLGHPGVLPVINRQAVEWTVLAGLGLNCNIPSETKFDRKNYFYPDLPKGYQISQYDLPIAVGGYLKINDHKIRIRRIHLEEDAAKNLHAKDHSYSLVDYNRAGTPLMETVTEPDIRSPQEAGNFLRELRLIMRYLGVSRADMEKGELRCDANINIKCGKEKTAIVEIKNMNSFKAVEKALLYEEKRQIEDFNSLKKRRGPEGETTFPYGAGKTTRGWDEKKEKTIEQRTKEEAHDYRYFPEPDLPPLSLDSIAEVMKKKIPELPEERRERFKKEYNLAAKHITILVENRALGDFYEQVISEAKAETRDRKIYKLTANWVLTELQKLLKSSNVKVSQLKISPENFAEFINIVKQGKINSSQAQIVLEKMFERGSDPQDVIRREGLLQISGTKELGKIIEEVVQENPKAVADFKKGKEETIMFLVGQVMRKTQGKANPQVVQKILREKLK